MQTTYEIDGIKFTLEAIRNAKSVRVDGKAKYEIRDVTGAPHVIGVDRMTMLSHLSYVDAVDCNQGATSAASVPESFNTQTPVPNAGNEMALGADREMVPTLRDSLRHESAMVD